MRPLLECPVAFRLSAETYRKYEQEAAQAGLDLSKYLRNRLEAEDSVAEHVSQLRLALMDGGVAPQDEGPVLPILLELLLLARRQTAPGDMRAVHYELERLGSKPWTPDLLAPSTDA